MVKQQSQVTCPSSNYTGGPGNYAFLLPVIEQMETCTCLGVSQRAEHWSHEQFSGRQSHVSSEGYTRINPFQLQQIHSGGDKRSEMHIKLTPLPNVTDFQPWYEITKSLLPSLVLAFSPNYCTAL